jgi:DNA polymerase III sliding clamp (beta) subunit (PCNA family)
VDLGNGELRLSNEQRKLEYPSLCGMPVAFEGGGFTMGINANFWLGALEKLSEPEVTIALLDQFSPMVVHAPNFLYVCMPVRLD